MNYIRYRQPQTSFDRLSSLRHLLDSAFTVTNYRSSAPEAWSPALDLFEDNERVTVRLEVAGLRKEDFDISLNDDVLTISGQRKPAAVEGEGTERVYAAFTRSVNLPGPVNADAVNATYEDGVLTLTLPKAEEAKPRKITLN